jgi:Zn-dependent protease
MSASIKIGRILGIPIYLHLTFLLILPLFVLVFSSSQETEAFGIPLTFGSLDAETWIRYVFGTAAAVLFFVTILIHELAHSYLAQRYGVKIKGITLMIFGGVSSMEEMPRKPGQEWRMAFAGPFSSLVIGVVAFLVMVLFKEFQPGSMLLEATIILLGMLAFYNILLAGFNLIPAFPMDGGRLVRAYYATKMSYMEATKKAARIGRYFAIGMGVFGIFLFNFFLILIALFVYIGATEEEQATTISESLQGVQVRSLMADQVQVVHPDTTVQQLHDLMLMTGHMGFPVVDNGLVGIVTLTDTHKVSKDRYQDARVRDIMTAPVVTVPPEMDASKALYLMSERRVGRLVVMQGPQLIGIVTRKDFLRAIDVFSVRKQTMRWGEQFRPPAPPPTV